MRSVRTVCTFFGATALLWAGGAMELRGAHAAGVGDRYLVSGRCVTITRIAGTQASYTWTEGNASGSGSLPVSHLSQACGAAAAPSAVPTPPAPPTPPSQVPTPPAPPPPAAGGALTAAEAQAMVAAHNAVRAEVGVGPVEWDRAVAAYAQGYVATLAASCSLSHSSSQYGENLAAWSGVRPVSQAVTQWASEKALYHGGGGPFESGDGAGHYTQVVWRASTRIGCGRTICKNGGFEMTLISCNYSPVGNMMGAAVY